MNRYATYIGFIAATVLIIGGLVYIVRSGTSQVANVIEGDEAGILTTDQVKGNPESGVVLIKYSDFECPGCQTFDGFLRDLVEKKGDSFALVYRHFPLSQIHRYADAAARSAEAAGRQGKFWEMHNKIFDTQRVWAANPTAQTIFESYAKELGLDMTQYAQDFSDKELRSKINSDYQMGVRAGVAGTPTFFINGKQVVGLRNMNDLEIALDTAIQARNSTQNATTTPAVTANPNAN